MGVGERSLVVLIAATLVAAACTTVPPSGGGGSTSEPMVGGCQAFPTDNAWNTPIDTAAVRSDSSTMVAKISSTGGRSFLHADFGGNGAYGIPYLVVPSTEPKVTINYTAYGDESDPGPFPIPKTAPIEGGSSSTGDRHVIVVQQGACHLYELYRAFWSTNEWDADSGATWELGSDALRPAGWTSADAAGLPILPGLVRYDEVAAGQINHALRFTVAQTQKGYISPARHYASSSTDATLPPMGLRLRLKASFSLAGYTGESLVILKALKKYGMIVADNGSSWFITGASDTRWNDTDLDQLKNVPGSAFEAVDTGPIQH
jgi:hypothetical protein